MKKEILNEIDQMKYLFDYKAGRVVSEQVKPTGTPQQPATTGQQPTNQTTKIPANSPLSKVDQRFMKLIPEILSMGAKNKKTFISPLFPKSIITFEKDTSGRDQDYFRLDFTINTPHQDFNQYLADYYHVWLSDINKSLVDSAMTSPNQSLETMSIGNLDYQQVYGLWNQGRVRPYFDTIKSKDPKLIVLRTASQWSPVGIWRLLFRAMDTDKNVVNAAKLLQQLNPNIASILQDGLKYETSDEIKKQIQIAVAGLQS